MKKLLLVLLLLIISTVCILQYKHIIYLDPYIYKVDILKEIFYDYGDKKDCLSYPYFDERKELVSYIRKHEVLRNNHFTFTMDEVEDIEKEFEKLVQEVDEHTGVPNEGDYLERNRKSYKLSYYTEYEYVKVSVEVEYYTTYEMEQEIDKEVQNIIQSLDLNSKNVVEKIDSIYYYICSNVEYDYDDTNEQRYSSYSAFINHKTVCQGYSMMLYRLCLEVGIDCRIILGTVSTGNHSWNIIQLDDHYYYFDPTWDHAYLNAGLGYNYKFKSESDFNTHTPFEQYTTEEFKEMYPTM